MSKNYALLLITMLSATVLCANHENGHTLPVHLLDGLTQNSTEPSVSWEIGHLPLSQPLTNGAPTVGAQATFSPGDIIVTEIMQNPKKISDNDGEWFELYNTTSAPIDLIGWTIKDLSNGNNHTIASNVVVQPGGYALLMRQGNPAINGGLTADYVYGFTVSFRNDGDEVVIEDPSGHEIDRVAYDDGTVWPNPDGASMSLDPSFYNATDNDNGIYWCEATSMYDPDNRGTPGAANAFCFPPMVAICKDIDVELGSDGMADITANQIDDGSNSPFGVQSLSLDISTFSCTDIGENTVTLIVTDQAGNDDSCQGKVNVEDNVAPDALCRNVTVQLNDSGNGSTTAAAVDNGSNDACGAASLALSQTDFGCADVGANTVTLTVTESTCQRQRKHLRRHRQRGGQRFAPDALCQNVTVQLNDSGNGSTTAAAVDNGSNDACGAASLALSQTDFGCADVGANTVTLTVTDANGNESTCDATVTVEDNVAPDALCRNVTVQLNDSGNGSTTAAAVDNGSNDACGAASLALSQTDFGCADVGANTVTLTVTESTANGNESTCDATVTVEDNVAPDALCRPRMRSAGTSPCSSMTVATAAQPQRQSTTAPMMPAGPQAWPSAKPISAVRMSAPIP